MYKKRILELREEGKTYNEIAKELGCSKGTISYHCNNNVKTKTKKRNRKHKKSSKYILNRKIDMFVGRSQDQIRWQYVERTDINDKIYKKFVQNPYCYITKEKIDFSNSSSYSVDHIIPISKGGDNTLDNAGLCLSVINKIKSDLSLDELKFWCSKILNNIDK